MGCQLVHRHQNLYSQPLICLCVRWQQGDVPASAKIWLLGHRAIQLHQMLTRTALLTLALARLYEPSLTASQRTGTLPMVAWANLSAMTSFSISNNNMTGTLPSQLAAAWPKLAVLSVNQNRFEGKAHAHMQRAASVWSVWLTLWQGKHGAADAQKICRHPPTCLVHTTAADARRELQQHCGCVLWSWSPRRCLAAALPVQMPLLPYRYSAASLWGTFYVCLVSKLEATASHVHTRTYVLQLLTIYMSTTWPG